MLQDNSIALLILISVIAVIATTIFFYANGKETTDVSGGLKKEAGSTESLKSGSVLNPVEFRKFKIIKTDQVSKDTKLIRVQIPNSVQNKSQSLGLPIGRHITVQAVIDGAKVMRPYTPCSKPNEVGYFELLIKSYEFGKMSSYIHSLTVGSE